MGTGYIVIVNTFIDHMLHMKPPKHTHTNDPTPPTHLWYALLDLRVKHRGRDGHGVRRHAPQRVLRRAHRHGPGWVGLLEAVVVVVVTAWGRGRWRRRGDSWVVIPPAATAPALPAAAVHAIPAVHVCWMDGFNGSWWSHGGG